VSRVEVGGRRRWVAELMSREAQARMVGRPAETAVKASSKQSREV
jgi:hypothetical protein